MEFLQNAVEWFKSLSNGLKVALILAALIVGILASQAFYIIAILVFIVGIVALIVQAVRRRPLRQWGIVTGSALVLAFVFGSISGGSPAPTEQGSQEETVVVEETAEEPTEEEPAIAEEEAQAEPEPEPEPEPPAPSQEQDEPAEEPTAGIGDVVEVADGIWVVTSARQEAQLADQFGVRPPKQGNFVIVDFRFKNDANEAKTLHTAAMKLIDKEDREFDPDTDSFGYIPQEKNVLLEQVNPGVTKEGQVIFSVSPDASGFKLQVRATNLFSLEEPKEVALGF